MYTANVTPALVIQDKDPIYIAVLSNLGIEEDQDYPALKIIEVDQPLLYPRSQSEEKLHPLGCRARCLDIRGKLEISR